MADQFLAATGRPVPSGDPDRRWAVDRGGLRPGAVLIDDFIESSERLADAMEGVDDWSSLDRTTCDVPGRRLVQLLVHHADLTRGWDHVSEEVASIAVSLLPTVMPDELSGIRLVARPGRRTVVVESSVGQTVVEGDPRSLLAWASGRAETVEPGTPQLSRRVGF